ncbi:hypothetical protein DSECCO2_662840 [anaerobic digester metagenome]
MLKKLTASDSKSTIVFNGKLNPVFNKHFSAKVLNDTKAFKSVNVTPFNVPILSEATIETTDLLPISFEKKSGMTKPAHFFMLLI